MPNNQLQPTPDHSRPSLPLRLVAVKRGSSPTLAATMKRDIELIRTLLGHFESKPGDGVETTVPVDGYSKLEVDYHLILMDEAGLLRCEREVSKSGRTIRVYPLSLTWQGHEFLDASRNEGVWKSVKERVGNNLTAVPFDVLRALLIQAAKDAVSGPGS